MEKNSSCVHAVWGFNNNNNNEVSIYPTHTFQIEVNINIVEHTQIITFMLR